MLRFFKRKTNIVSNEELSSGIYDLIRKILPDEMKNTRLDNLTKFTDIGFDSIMFMNFLLGLEDILDKDLEKIVAQVDISSITTIGDAVYAIEKIL